MIQEIRGNCDECVSNPADANQNEQMQIKRNERTVLCLFCNQRQDSSVKLGLKESLYIVNRQLAKASDECQGIRQRYMSVEEVDRRIPSSDQKAWISTGSTFSIYVDALSRTHPASDMTQLVRKRSLLCFRNMQKGGDTCKALLRTGSGMSSDARSPNL